MTKSVDSSSPILLKVRRLGTSDVADYRDLRLEGLKGHPEAFASSWEHEADKPLSWWAERLETSSVFGGWVNSSRLVGVAGLRVQDAVKLRHKGVLVGMYVRPEARGTGLAAALVQQVVEHARTLVEEVCLTVVTSNAAARRLYSAAGFKEYGLERRALKVGSEYYDEVLMTLPLTPHPEPAPGD
jgi:RimJ/RimL family protein N-acetyltransferase